MKVLLFLSLFLFLLNFQANSVCMDTDSDSQNIYVKVVEGTLYLEYRLATEGVVCSEGETLDITAHISWQTEKEKTTVLSLTMKGTPYTESDLSELVNTPLTLESQNGSFIYESEDISGFWDSWFDKVTEYGFFAGYSRTVMQNWNEVEMTLHEDYTERVYSLKAVYYDFFTKFYPTPEDFFAEREVDFQLIFGIHSIAPLTPLVITIELPEDVEVVKVEPPTFSVAQNTFTHTVAPGEKVSTVRIRFKMGRYEGTELPRLQVEKACSHVVTVGERIDITITVENTASAEASHVTIQDDLPDEFEIAEGNPSLYAETLEGNQKIVLMYTVTPTQPGDFVLKGARVEFEDQFGKVYTVYSDDISIAVVKESGGSSIIILIVLTCILILKRGE